LCRGVPMVRGSGLCFYLPESPYCELQEDSHGTTFVPLAFAFPQPTALYPHFAR
jgi:hypothetical protein